MNKNWRMTCPKCGKTVYYWPNCSKTTALDYDNYEWVVTKDGYKQFFHKRCDKKRI